MSIRITRAAIGAFCAAALALTAAPGAPAAFDDPLFVVRPARPQAPQVPVPPPEGDLEAPCGVAVDDEGRVLVSEYYKRAIDIFAVSGAQPFGPVYPYGYAGQVLGLNALLGGPCGMAFDADGSLYLYDYHRAVFKLDPSFSSTTPTAGAGVDEAHPTGVGVNRANGNVFVDERNRIAVYSSAGALLRVLGASSLGDGYGLAVSEYFGSKGLLYVADAADDTVKVYAPAPLNPDAPPVAVIDGSATPVGHFVSLRDAALAVDRESGEVYVTDNLQPEYAERPETVVYVFDAAGDYRGRLKYSIENAVPPGLAVDNSEKASQGRVYVTSGNTEDAAVYAYRPGSATTGAVPVPSLEEPASPGASSFGPAAPQGLSASMSSAPGAASPSATANATASAPGAKSRARSKARRSRAKAHRRAKDPARKRAGRGSR